MNGRSAPSRRLSSTRALRVDCLCNYGNDVGVAAEQPIADGSSTVDSSDAGARRLGTEYLAEIGRATRGLIKPRAEAQGVDLVLGGRITLFRFGPPQPTVEDDRTECRFEIRGGLLVGREGGSLVITQRSGPAPELIVEVDGYVPRLDPAVSRRGIGGFLYRQIQERAHGAISRRFVARMAQPRA